MKKKRYFKEEFIGAHRFELFKRDPLAIEMESLFRKSHSIGLSDDQKEALSYHVEQMIKDLMKKWNFHFIRNWNEQNIPAEPFSWFKFSSGAFTVANAGEYVEEFREKLKLDFQDSTIGFPNPRSLEHFERTGWVFSYLDGGYDDRGNVYIPVPPGSIPIIVDIGGLTEKSKDQITKEIWHIIKAEIRRRRSETKEVRRDIPAARDPQELGFLSKMAEDIFAKHLKWYDLHMGDDYQSPKGLRFRTIAALELVEQQRPERFEEGKRKILQRTKTVRIGQGEKEIRGYIGEPIKGEDNVEKGVKLIYRAIHRKSYPSRKKLSLYSCPQHGEDCPKDCSHLKEWMKTFNKRQMSKRLHTTDKIS